jgi:hypothetical protein
MTGKSARPAMEAETFVWWLYRLVAGFTYGITV